MDRVQPTAKNPYDLMDWTNLQSDNVWYFRFEKENANIIEGYFDRINKFAKINAGGYVRYSKQTGRLFVGKLPTTGTLRGPEVEMPRTWEDFKCLLLYGVLVKAPMEPFHCLET